MKKKNVIGHMEANKHAQEGWLRRSHLLARLVCLIIAAVIWLCVVDLTKDTPPQTPAGQSETGAGAE